MKNFLTTTAMVTILLSSCNNENKSGEGAEAAKDSAHTTTTESTTPALAPPIDTAAMTKAWMDFAKPGDMHAWMAKLNGSWEADITSYSNPAAPEKSKGKAVYTASLNGLYQEGKVSGTMMGMPFEGKSWMGYDNSKKMFVSTWIDNMGSGIVYMTGTYDEASKTLTLKGTQTDPYTGKDAALREVMKVTDDNNFSMEMYGAAPDGKEMKFMDAVYRRKQ